MVASVESAASFRAVPLGARRARGPAIQPVRVGEGFGAAVHQVGGVLSRAIRKLRLGAEVSQKRSRNTRVIRVAVPMTSLWMATSASGGVGWMGTAPAFRTPRGTAMMARYAWISGR